MRAQHCYQEIADWSDTRWRDSDAGRKRVALAVALDQLCRVIGPSDAAVERATGVPAKTVSRSRRGITNPSWATVHALAAGLKRHSFHNNRLAEVVDYLADLANPDTCPSHVEASEIVILMAAEAQSWLLANQRHQSDLLDARRERGQRLERALRCATISPPPGSGRGGRAASHAPAAKVAGEQGPSLGAP